MPCGCKKSFCNTKVCKCKKEGDYCSQKCSCSKEKCKNFQIEEQEKQDDEVEDTVNEEQLSWTEVLEISSKCLEMIQKENKRCADQPVPDNVKNVVKSQQAFLKNMENLCGELEQLSLQRMNGAVLKAEEWQDFEKSLISCIVCKRKFTPGERIQKHEAVCQRRSNLNREM